ncbi:MAG: STAS domain-containing protein [Ilumatobacteraceae bacterium]
MSDPSARLDITRAVFGLVLAGEVDAHTAPDLAANLEPLPAGDGDVVLDLADVGFMDSSALRVLVEAHDRAAAHGRRLVLRAPSAAVRRLLEVSGLSEHLAIE